MSWAAFKMSETYPVAPPAIVFWELDAVPGELNAVTIFRLLFVTVSSLILMFPVVPFFEKVYLPELLVL